VQLLGGHFDGHPGDVRVASCRSEGDHPAVARLPETFEARDEYYLFRSFRPDNRVVIRCTTVEGRGTIPVAWYREEGQGRVFYTCFGHTDETWTERRLVQDHVVPALLWTLGR
jgi:cytochrome c